MSLRERLERLDRSPASSPGADSRLPDLRQRLDRLLGAGTVLTGAQLEQRGPARARRPVEALVDGRRVEAASGPAFLCETLVPPDHRHGRLPVAELVALPRGAIRLFPSELAGVERAEELAFLDTETTGLAGGAGTVAFLIGVARWSPDGLRITQLFLEDLDGEAALLEVFAEALRGVRCLVTYNGGPYDVPLLENRHILNRKAWPAPEARHLDLLPPARTLWRPRHTDCRLTTLEQGVLGHVRADDIPGAEIPAVYADYLRRGAGSRLAAVFDHNRQDLLSLAGLLWASARAAEGHPEKTGAGVGLLHARRGRREEAEQALEACLREELPRDARARALRELSLSHKAAGRWKRALELWLELRTLCPAGDPFAYEEAAKVLEHRLSDPAGALAVVDDALARGPWAPRDREAFEHRRRRLCRKLRPEVPDEPGSRPPPRSASSATSR
ncbi:MAG: ribonuclease H-like domain-containing protein [Deltaproteobacteria bacterium]|nr:ribonuclease H-like domain-containing protein [Deltaproteobacteria bacterium]